MNSNSQPTLWRTCRALANPSRLRLFAALVRKQPQTVSGLAEQVGLSLPLASMFLRTMESRGLLSVRRLRRNVEYQISAAGDEPALAELIKALKSAIKHEEKPIALIFHLATGFTHPARVEVYRQLAVASAFEEDLAHAMQLSLPAIRRHVQKLLRRGYLKAKEQRYEVVQHPHEVGRVLAKLALR
jgi:DNA-binding transcriptional ArsR family regulator